MAFFLGKAQEIFHLISNEIPKAANPPVAHRELSFTLKRRHCIYYPLAEHPFHPIHPADEPNLINLQINSKVSNQIPVFTYR